jgi:predicted dehydrogenase
MSTKIAIIGAGGMAAYHAKGFREAGADLVALADVNGAAAEKAAARHGIGRHFSDVGEMLKRRARDRRGVDHRAKQVPRPARAAGAQGGQACVLREAARAQRQEMAQLKAAADKAAKRTLMFNFNNRARPESYAMMEYISQGVVGTINSCQAKWIRRTGIPGFGGWFTTKALSGGGPLIDLLHMVDLGLYFMGYPEPAHVLAQTYQDSSRTSPSRARGASPTWPRASPTSRPPRTAS